MAMCTTDYMTYNGSTTGELYIDKVYADVNASIITPEFIYDPAMRRYKNSANVEARKAVEEAVMPRVNKERRLDLCSRHLWN